MAAAPGTVAHIDAQAKINLFLRVLAREPDGYHQVETLFTRIGLSDRVTIRVGGQDRALRCTGERLPAEGLGDRSNLAWQAAVAYAASTGFPGGFEIEIEKRIPVGGGLGGGSADAGAVLRALNALNPSPVAPEQLLAVAGSLGADVPFLTQDASPLALAWGRGDRLIPLPPLPPRRVWLLLQPGGVATADAYRWLDEHPPTHASRSFRGDSLSSWDGVATLAGNDFEAPVGARVPRLATLLSTLRDPGFGRYIGRGAIVQMTGSGSTVFVLAGAPEADDSGFFNWRSDVDDLEVVASTTATFVEPVVVTD